jgi:hypothetical protein
MAQNSFMGMPIVASVESMKDGFAVVSTTGFGLDRKHHVVSWHPEMGVRETTIYDRDMVPLTTAGAGEIVARSEYK